ncbi:hypothetical protein ALC57_01950 [Trachymyrmex cornetzi]|uniref:Homeobox domain-containing protein n=1 Tax=Trachymyrmex cornetzi TaxID=471704 RepID=A0A151JPC1_9HYME|nr:hypothetical protein ALC57_01950 [Trachymyrmex cornetzi]
MNVTGTEFFDRFGRVQAPNRERAMGKDRHKPGGASLRPEAPNEPGVYIARRPNVRFNKKATEYEICVKCYGYFSKNTLQNHIRKCINMRQSRNRIVTVLGRTIRGRIHEVASQTLKKVIFPVLREDYRAQAKIHPNNPYLFGIVGFHKQRHKYLRACDLMRKFANECNADNPERLRGTSDDSENDSDNSNDEDGNVFDDKNNSNDNNNNSSINLNSTITDDFINDGNSMQESKMQSRCKRIRWNNEEKQIVLKIFDTYLNTYKCPTNKEIAALINANSCLQTRTVNQVKAWFNNQQRSIRNNSQA